MLDNEITLWLGKHNKNFNCAEIKQFQDAIIIAQKFYQDNNFYPTNVNLLKHALTCADTIAQLNLYADAVIATILFALPRYCNTWQEEVVNLGIHVIELIDGVNKVTQIRKLGTLADVDNTHQKKEHVEVVRKMLLAMASDIRIVIILLVGRNELMLNLKSCQDNEMLRKIAIETLEIFSPLANRLGLSQIKWALEDLSFKYLYPEQYKKIAKLLDETREIRLNYIETIKNYLSEQLDKSGIIKYQVTGRAKHIYSIWKKMKKNNYDFDELFDIRALRVLVPEIKDCYTVLGIVHTKYSPVPGEFDDYISNPKGNSYQSLHTCVFGPNEKIIEIQIRTYAMHNHAEYGVAAHWRYKELGSHASSEVFAEKITWLRQLLDWREELIEHNDVSHVFKNEIFSDTIYVISPDGKVVSLPSGATAIDFAYAIHSDIGNRCRGAKVDGQIIPLSTPLKNGQRVEILTVKEGGPSVGWLHDKLVKSTKAISHIRRYIRNQNNEEFYISGKEIFDREISKLPIALRPQSNTVISRLNYQNEKMLYIDLGRGEIEVSVLRNTLIRSSAKNDNYEQIIEPKISTYQTSGILVDGVSNLLIKIAKCCKPIPGDKIIGFITHGNGVVIHRNSCREIKRQAKNFPNKIVKVDFGNQIDTVFNADLEIIANDRPGLLRDFTSLFASEKLNINALRTICKDNRATMLFTLIIPGENFNFDKIINRVRNIIGVINVCRK